MTSTIYTNHTTLPSPGDDLTHIIHLPHGLDLSNDDLPILYTYHAAIPFHLMTFSNVSISDKQYRLVLTPITFPILSLPYNFAVTPDNLFHMPFALTPES